MKSPSLTAALVCAAALCLSACDEEPTASTAKQPTAPSSTTADTESTCENPEMDLMDTEFGLYASSARMALTGTDSWYNIRIADNQFDPCAEYSYVHLQGVVLPLGTSDRAAWESPFHSVLFFHGEHLIGSQAMPLESFINDVEITDDTATVTYQGPGKYQGARGKEYTVDYALQSTRVQESNDAPLADDLRTDLTRQPPPSDGVSFQPMGNAHHTPYDHEEDDWLNRYVNVPMGDHTLRCAASAPQSGVNPTQVECASFKPVFPDVDTRPEPGNEDRQLDNGKAGIASMSLSMPASLHTHDMDPGMAVAGEDMEDEAVTRIGNVYFDTRGETVTITDYHTTFILGEGRAEQTQPDIEPDKSRWPQDLKPWSS